MTWPAACSHLIARNKTLILAGLEAEEEEGAGEEAEGGGDMTCQCRTVHVTPTPLKCHVEPLVVHHMIGVRLLVHLTACSNIAT